ncbi:MAG: response regulator [Victivallales bacterium]|nr:response regulator [Victivallales bacterium]
MNESANQEELSQDYESLLVGMSILLEKGEKRVQAYNALLEDEWEGRGSALEFLHKQNDILKLLLGVNNVVAAQIRAEANHEILGVDPLVEGVGGRLQAEQGCQLSLHCKAASILQGSAFQLQQMLLEMARNILSQEPEDAKRLAMTTFTANFPQGHLSLLRSELPPGDYAVLGLTSIPDSTISLQDYVTLADFLASQEEATAEVLPMLRWLGIVSIHKGDIFINRNGLANGLLMIFPPATSGEETGLRAKVVNGRPECILLVDDEDMIWDVVFSMLKDLGYDVVMAGNGQEAVEIYEANAPQIDLILLDMLMPVMNAREAFHLLKDFDPSVKVLLASGYVNEEDVQDVLGAGALGFLRKPYRLVDLARKIRHILDKG